MATQQWKHHVFVSFKGEDTRHNFVCHLYDALSRKGLNTFVDNQLRRGEEINTALLQAIHHSKVSIIIFSENYASSSWCLDELLKIIECHETRNQIVIPVFYRVNPSDVRKQNGSFEESFRRHSENPRYSNKIKKWKDALTKAANISGMGPDANREDNKLIDQIVKDVSQKLKHLYPCSLEGFVGLKSKISEVKTLLATGSSDVRMLGIWGMGGIGKTTLARAIFDEVSSQFEGRCFVRNVREVSEKEGMEKLLQQLISDLLEERDLKIDTPGLGLYFLERLKSKRVFVVFDDVSDRSQLEYLIRNQSWFGVGSNIIITSRDKQVFQGITDNIYKVEALSDTKSHQLFVRNAFKERQPSQDHIPLIGSFVNYARGNPLAIKVLGSYVCGKGVKLWRDALNKLSKCPYQKIQNVLKRSYDGLDREEQAIFLHIACFFKGENIDEAKRVFSSCGLSADIGVSRLVDKSLVTISKYDRLDMHDLLQEMSREIIRQESNDPRHRSRLWDAEEIRHVFEENEGTEAIEIESISLNTSQIRDIILDPNVFKRMPNLKFLRFYTSWDERSKLHLTRGLHFLPSGLRYLYWDEYPLESLPTDFDAKELLVLHLPKSNIKQILKEGKGAGKLKVVAQSLIESPLISRVTDIVFGKLPYGIGNIKVPSSSCQFFSKMTILDMSCCKNLRSFPNNVDLQCLEILDLNYCSNLKIFPEISTNLRKLCVGGTAIKEVHSSSIERLSKLQKLAMHLCGKLESLPSNICKLQALQHLHLLRCSSLKKFPEILEPMPNLREVCFSYSGIEAIPSFINNMKWLKSLDVSYSRIRELPKDLGSLYYLRELNLNGNPFVEIPASIKQLSLLESLRLDHCRELQSLPQLPTSLCQLTAVGCKSLKTLLAFTQPIFSGGKMDFCKCLKLEEKECEAMTYKLLRNGPKDVCLRYPGSRIPEWFRHQSTRDIIRIKLPSNWFFNRRFFGFAFFITFYSLYRLDICHVLESNNYVEFECYFEDNYNPTVRFTYKTNCNVTGLPRYLLMQHQLLVWCFHDFNVWISERRQLFRLHCINMASFKFFIRGNSKIKKCGITPLYMQVNEGYVQGGDDEQDDADENAYWMLESLLPRKMSTKMKMKLLKKDKYYDEDMNSEDTDDDMIPKDDEDELFDTDDDMIPEDDEDELFETEDELSEASDELSEANDELSETVSSND
ncbi:hypothetical protein K2173_006796 [Erythroxylum novogranatense]|uniref:ADP-ribosyl cyclase/cyclic ADP-ribose hydrolase n=1 Tax=Erythroxylum novogranatense TaxID=1862640 RepID=A0AAV8SXR9_9ROSI|nr:hypothetical protein K2173_006796 [Erythroxylum novogranatense]